MLSAFQCFSIGFLIAATTRHDLRFPLPAPARNGSSSLLFDNFTCTTVVLPETNVHLSDRAFNISFVDPGVVTCSGQWGNETDGVTTWKGPVWLDISIAQGALGGTLLRAANSTGCAADGYTLDSCSIDAKIVHMNCLPAFSECSTLMFVAKLALDALLPTLCPAVGNLLGNLLTNRTADAPVAIPAPRPGSPPLLDNAYIRMANNVVGELPLIDGMKINLTVPGANYANLKVDMARNISISASRLVPGLYDLQMPRGLAANMDVLIQYFVCAMRKGTCTLSGLSIYNLRLRGLGGEDLGLDNIAGFFLQSLIDPVLMPAADENETNRNDTLNFTLFPSHELLGPPPYVIGLIGIVPAFFATLLLGLSMRYHLRRAHAMEKQEDVRRGLIPSDLHIADDDPRRTGGVIVAQRTTMRYSVARGYLRDVVIILLCGSAMIMFIYANADTAVTVVLGGEIRIFAFSLQNSVHDFWVSGLKALSFFIAFFSGAYPYIKIVAICSIAIVHRNTNSRLLRTIDSLGRFSFLDSFVMMVLVTTLQVPGIAEVHAHLPFYSFIGGTVLSMVAGNIATHTYDVGLIIEVFESSDLVGAMPTSDSNFGKGANDKSPGKVLIGSQDEEDDLDAPRKQSGGGDSHKINASTAHNSNNNNAGYGSGSSAIITSSDDQKKSQKWLAAGDADPSLYSGDGDAESQPVQELEKPAGLSRPALYALFVLGCVGVWTGLWYGWFAGTLRYEFTGVVTVLKGDHQDYSLQRLFFESPPLLGATAVITIVILPLLMTIFPNDRLMGFIAPWCSTDVFLVTCLAALMQLHQFIKYQAGPVLGLMINANARLLPPFYVVAMAAVLQWVYIARAAIGREPNTQRSSTGRPAERVAPPTLFFAG